jgi:hypothetical protein
VCLCVYDECLCVFYICCRCMIRYAFAGIDRFCYLLGSLISGLGIFEASCQEGVIEHCGF